MSEGRNAAKTLATSGYSLKTTSDNPVLIEIDAFDEESGLVQKKVEKPEFYFALLLKQQIRALKAETGTVPDRLAFCLFNTFTMMETSNIEQIIAKACDLMNVKQFVFVPFA